MRWAQCQRPLPCGHASTRGPLEPPCLRSACRPLTPRYHPWSSSIMSGHFCMLFSSEAMRPTVYVLTAGRPAGVGKQAPAVL